MQKITGVEQNNMDIRYVRRSFYFVYPLALLGFEKLN